MTTHHITQKLLIICGPTASGKSSLAMQLAHELNGEIINADSMQIYRGMDIGTAKPIRAERATVPHHLIDIVTPDQSFSAADFADAADKAIADITQRGKRPIVVGGTGLYIRSLLKGLIDSPGAQTELREKLHEQVRRDGNLSLLQELEKVDPQLAQQLHPNNLVRIIRGLEVYHQTGIPLSHYQQEHGFQNTRYESLQIGVAVERKELYRRIDERVEQMLTAGLQDEVNRLMAQGYGVDTKAMRSIGYKEMLAFFEGTCDFSEAVRLIKRNTRHYAKRQLTWFTREQDILWLEYPEKFATILKYAIEFFEPRGNIHHGKNTI